LGPKTEGREQGPPPHGDTVLHDGDVLVVGGTKKALDSSPLVQPDGR
jgi:Trk K+ transport system NAD-binding subunit